MLRLDCTVNRHHHIRYCLLGYRGDIVTDGQGSHHVSEGVALLTSNGFELAVLAKLVVRGSTIRELVATEV